MDEALALFKQIIIMLSFILCMPAFGSGNWLTGILLLSWALILMLYFSASTKITPNIQMKFLLGGTTLIAITFVLTSKSIFQNDVGKTINSPMTNASNANVSTLVKPNTPSPPTPKRPLIKQSALVIKQQAVAPKVATPVPDNLDNALDEALNLTSNNQSRSAIPILFRVITAMKNGGKSYYDLSYVYALLSGAFENIYDCKNYEKYQRLVCQHEGQSEGECDIEVANADCPGFAASDKAERIRKGMPLP